MPPGCASTMYSTYRYGLVGNCGSITRPRRPRSPTEWTCVRRSATCVGVESEALSYSLMMPSRSATKNRPSGAIVTAVGVFRPVKSVATWKPGSITVAAAVPIAIGRFWNASATVVATTSARRQCPRPGRRRSQRFGRRMLRDPLWVRRPRTVQHQCWEVHCGLVQIARPRQGPVALVHRACSTIHSPLGPTSGRRLVRHASGRVFQSTADAARLPDIAPTLHGGLGSSTPAALPKCAPANGIARCTTASRQSHDHEEASRASARWSRVRSSMIETARHRTRSVARFSAATRAGRLVARGVEPNGEHSRLGGLAPHGFRCIVDAVVIARRSRVDRSTW